MIIPEGYNYIAIFLTLRCNLGCSYCINGNSTVVRERDEINGDEWVQGLNRLKIKKDTPISLEGGEPTMHPDFYQIIERVNHPIDILTNLQFNIDAFINRVDPYWLCNGTHPSYKPIRASFHPERMDLEKTLEKAAKLQNAGFEIGLFSLNLPESIESNMLMAERAREERIYFFIKDFLGQRDKRVFGHYKYPDALGGEKRHVNCRIKELLVAPDGNIFRCHRDLYAAENSIHHLLSGEFVIEDIFRPCTEYGTCNPCDVKLKTNRFLQMGSCSVEIKETSDFDS